MFVERSLWFQSGVDWRHRTFFLSSLFLEISSPSRDVSRLLVVCLLVKILTILALKWTKWGKARGGPRRSRDGYNLEKCCQRASIVQKHVFHMESISHGLVRYTHWINKYLLTDLIFLLTYKIFPQWNCWLLCHWLAFFPVRKVLTLPFSFEVYVCVLVS